jgi:hypothetical protein
MQVGTKGVSEMERGRHLSTFTLLMFLMVGTFSVSYAQPPVKPKIPVGSRINIPDDPQVREFSANPARVVRGRNMILRWRVEPGPGGSPITGIRILKTEGSGPSVNLRSSDLTGERTVNIPIDTPIGRTVYALAAVNQAWGAAVRTVSPEVMDPPDIVVQEINAEDLSHSIIAPDKYYAIYFDIRNSGGEFLGTMTLTALVEGRTIPIAESRSGFREAAVPLVIPDFRLSSGETRRFWLRGSDMAYTWIGSTYNCTVRLSTSSPDEVSTNNEKQARLSLPRR